MAPGKSTKVRAQRASRARGKPIPKSFCSRRKIQTGYDGYLAASTTPQWATHAHAAILRSTVATTTRATSASVPYPCWRTDGDPVNYCNFIRSFENLIEAKTKNSSTRLYYLMQHTFGDVQELMWSCLSMQPEESIQESRKLLKTRYGQNCKTSIAYVKRVTNGPSITYEDSQVLQKFSVHLMSCKNTSKEIGCLNNVETPDSLQRLIERLPFQLRQRWHDVADDITSNKQREITLEDISRFLESKARALDPPIFGYINSNL